MPMYSKGYSIVMFAYNEAKNIESSIRSVIKNVDSQLVKFTVLVNGSTDNTAHIVKELIANGASNKLALVELTIGDKCNAWNTYIHSLALDCEMHFFLDADVKFTEQAFTKMYSALTNDTNANAIAGLPFSGRNIKQYEMMVKDYNCIFGNCYGLSHDFIQLIRRKHFKLPIGLGWIDSAITKIVNRDIEDIPNPKKGKVIYHQECGYTFKSLSPFNIYDIRLYINRITRYRLGKMQEKYLEQLSFLDWPHSLADINQKVLKDINQSSHWYNLLERKLVAKRIQSQASKLSDNMQEESKF